MSEVVYNTLDYTKPISTLSFIQVLKDLLANKINFKTAQLTLEQFKQFLSIIYVYNIHYNYFEDKVRPDFLNVAKEERFPLFDIPKKFGLHLLNNLNTRAQEELLFLQKMEHNLLKPLSNNQILDFVEEELTDVTESYRKWEYGRFVAENILEYLFKNPIWHNNELNEKQIAKIEKHIDRSGSELSAQEKLFLKLTIKAKLNTKHTSMVDYLMISTIFKQKIFSMSLKIDTITNILDASLKAAKNIHRGKGGHNL